MITYFLLAFVCLIPLFAKNIDYVESILFYGIPIILYLLATNLKIPQKKLPPKLIIIEIILLVLSAISTILSIDKGISYYSFFIFFTVIYIVNLLLIYPINNTHLEIALIGSSTIYSFIFLLNTFHILPLDVKVQGDNFIKQIWGHSYLSEYLTLTLPFALKYYLNNKNRWLIPILIIIPAQVFTNSRANLIASILCIAFIFILTKKTQQKLKILPILIISCVAIFILQFNIQTGHFINKTFDGSRLIYWQQALTQFKNYPIFGAGPGTFMIANLKYPSVTDDQSTLAHSSFFGFLSENGIIFTTIFYVFFLYVLIKNFNNDPFITLAIASSLLASLFDASWNSPGILILVLYLLLRKIKLASSPSTSRYLSITTFLLILFFISKTISDILFLSHHYTLSTYFDPINPNPRIALLKTDSTLLQSTIYLYANDADIYKKSTESIPYPKNIVYLEKLIDLDPSNNFYAYEQLFTYYQSISPEKLISLANKLTTNYPETNRDIYSSLPIAKTLYHLAQNTYAKNPEQSLKYLTSAVNFSQSYAPFYIELINALKQSNHPQSEIDYTQNKCLQNSFAKMNCLNYLKYNTLPFGSLNQEIEAL